MDSCPTGKSERLVWIALKWCVCGCLGFPSTDNMFVFKLFLPEIGGGGGGLPANYNIFLRIWAHFSLTLKISSKVSFISFGLLKRTRHRAEWAGCNCSVWTRSSRKVSTVALESIQEFDLQPQWAQISESHTAKTCSSDSVFSSYFLMIFSRVLFSRMSAYRYLHRMIFRKQTKTIQGYPEIAGLQVCRKGS